MAGGVVDRVTEVTLGWLGEQVSRHHEYDYSAWEIRFGPDAESWVTDVVVRGFEAAVREVVAPGPAAAVLDTVMRDAPDDVDLQVAPDADLPHAVVEHLAPELGALAGRGLHVDTTRLTAALNKRIAAAVETDLHTDNSKLPLAMFLSGLPGFPFTRRRGDDDDDDDGDDGEDEAAAADLSG
jgi:hypothetical protein